VNQEIVAAVVGTEVGVFSLADGTEKWKLDLGVEFGEYPLLLDDVLVVTHRNGPRIVGLRLEDGKGVWELELPSTPEGMPAVVGNELFVLTEEVGSREAVLAAMDLSTSRSFWGIDVGEGASSPALIGDDLVVGTGQQSVIRVSQDEGATKWKAQVEDLFDPLIIPVIAFGDVFLADRIGNIYRLDGETGERKWIFSDTEGTFDQSSPVIAGQTLYIGSSAGWLYGVDVETGELVWRDRVDGFVLSGAADEERFYFGVKFGEQGLYAYEHDPSGGTSRDRTEFVVGAIAILGVLLAAVVIFVRRRSKPAA
jgi:outer membrane protein assembly factor BamB